MTHRSSLLASLLALIGLLALPFAAACSEDLHVVVVPLCAPPPAGVTQLRVKITLSLGREASESYEVAAGGEGENHALAAGLDVSEIMEPRPIVVEGQDGSGRTLAVAEGQIVNGEISPGCLFMTTPGDCQPVAAGSDQDTGCVPRERCHPVSRTCVIACNEPDAPECPEDTYCNVSWEVCFNPGPRVPADNPVVGDPCGDDRDCPANATCLTEEEGYPDGYCTIWQCALDRVTLPCTGNAFCLGLVEGVSACLQTCRVNEGGCRPGYVCRIFGDQAVCLP